MTTSVESITTSMLDVALIVATMRHQAIASNIANVNTEGYVPKSVNFRDALSAAQEILRERGRLSQADLTSLSRR